MRAFAISLIGLSLVACASTSSKDPNRLTDARRSAMLSELHEQQGTWANHALPRYSYTVSLDCGLCPEGSYTGPNKLTFEGGAVVSQKYVGKTVPNYRTGGEFMYGEELSGEYGKNNSIEELFSKIETYLNKETTNSQRKHAAKNVYFTVDYHQNFGFPVKIWRSDMTVMDSAFIISVENFEPY